MLRLRLVVVLLVGVASCNENNNLYCPSGPNATNTACLDGPPADTSTDAGSDTGTGIDAAVTCTANAACSAVPGSPVCDLSLTPPECVHCTAADHALCTGTTPACTAHTCVACSVDADCDTGSLCLPTGACAGPSETIHAVSSGGSTDSTTCGGTGAGSACTLTAALAAVTATKNVIKLDDAGPYKADSNGFIAATNVTILAHGATLTRNDPGPILSINSAVAVTIVDGTLQTANGTGGDGISCNGGTLNVIGTTIKTCDESAIDATNCSVAVSKADFNNNSKRNPAIAGLYPGINVSGGSITLSRSVITATPGGGIIVGNNAKFIIVGNAFLANGDAASLNSGGISIATTPNSDNRLDFNTVSANKSQDGVAPGVRCVVAGFVAKNNIISNNIGTPPVDGGCKYAYSDIIPTVPTANDGGMNISTDPMLIDPTMDFHLQSTSMARGHADPNADLSGIALRDIDGDLRAAPADIGADQFVPTP